MPAPQSQQSFGIAMATSQVDITSVVSSVAYGDEQNERLKVSVVPQDGGTPTGTVTISEGALVLCTVTWRLAALRESSRSVKRASSSIPMEASVSTKSVSFRSGAERGVEPPRPRGQRF